MQVVYLGDGQVITRLKRGRLRTATAGRGAAWWTTSGTSTSFTPIHKESTQPGLFIVYETSCHSCQYMIWISTKGMGSYRSPARWALPRPAYWGWRWWGWAGEGHVAPGTLTRGTRRPVPWGKQGRQGRQGGQERGRQEQVTRWPDNTQTPRVVLRYDLKCFDSWI